MIAGALPLVPKPIVRTVASRYVAGEQLDEAVKTIRALNEAGLCATLALLGEEVTERGAAEAAVEEYMNVLATIEREGLDANISIKLTLLGLEIDEGFCLYNLEKVVVAAWERGNFVRVDMEDHPCTDATLRMVREMQAKYGNVGTVLQAYLKRTPRDIREELPESNPNIRLCKGIYIEPEAIAYQSDRVIREKFLEALDLLFDHNVYTGIATHDDVLVSGALERIEERGLSRDRYEFQMLLGVTEQLRKQLIDDGHKVRVYVPYGADWYAYSVRRLRENPKIAWYVTRALFSPRG